MNSELSYLVSDIRNFFLIEMKSFRMDCVIIIIIINIIIKFNIISYYFIKLF